MKKRVFVLSAVAALAFAPGGSFANLVLDMPPILAKSTPCTSDAECGTGVCCNSKCYASGVCCGGSICYSPKQCVSGVCQSVVGDSALNDTGIDWSGTASSNAATCNDSSQDCGYGTNSLSFTSVTGGCVQDTVTGFIWSPDQGTSTWANIGTKETAAKNISLCGKTDWRAPTLKELLSIVSYNNMSSTPLVDSSFTVTGGVKTASPYWTKNDSVILSSLTEWTVSFSSGWSSKLTKTDSYNVILVSGSASTSSNFTVDDTAGTVTDNNTGLIWKKCLVGLSGTNCDQGSATTYTWFGALALTGNGWRLPNLKELQSLVDEGSSSPALDTSKFPNANYSVWTSSPYSKSVVVSGATKWKSWAIDFSSGNLGEYFRDTSLLRVRLVKDPTN